MPDLLIRFIAVLVLLAVATGGWLAVRHRRGNPRTVSGAPGVDAIAAAVTIPAAARQVVVQFSGPHCSACGPSARVWRSVVTEPDAFLSVDVTEHLDLTRTFGVLSTPTSLVFDGNGELRTRLTGPPSPARAREALALAGSFH
ncbi:thioredoxin family protein [Ruania halotolerans]|uniref:thioredoxin family protein n=1 Tax=Ruania halotolerans TaxID=2897773 RepID=UPI001E3319DC|nr:thioredoxin family protein [Ruania halotolerans]UFU08229.1 thioredoxin family protein [Ruania halotolerans]